MESNVNQFDKRLKSLQTDAKLIKNLALEPLAYIKNGIPVIFSDDVDILRNISPNACVNLTMVYYDEYGDIINKIVETMTVDEAFAELNSEKFENCERLDTLLSVRYKMNGWPVRYVQYDLSYVETNESEVNSIKRAFIKFVNGFLNQPVDQQMINDINVANDMRLNALVDGLEIVIDEEKNYKINII